MKCEYLLFNLVVLAGPVLGSFEGRVRFITHWPRAALACVIVLIPFGIWDSLVAGSHWRFNPQYTLGWTVAGLPIEEWMFFFAVPFALLALWEGVCTILPDRRIAQLWVVSAGLMLLIPAGAIVYPTGKHYTALALLALGIAVLLDGACRTGLLLRPRTLFFCGAVLLLILIFNGYLTWRPVVLYNPAYNIGVRIFTIPVEDFFYGLSLVLTNLVVYECLKRMGERRQAQSRRTD